MVVFVWVVTAHKSFMCVKYGSLGHLLLEKEEMRGRCVDMFLRITRVVPKLCHLIPAKNQGTIDWNCSSIMLCLLSCVVFF